ncbi:Sensory transduction protein LytR [Candidatus Izimaplasma bacterium HR1]|uniref:LytTR family DNA-binding domain-containing protein n=1 Tax=Candidatus Izimoplasma sp. HR1 TaxID=1541959 RepID=UPI0004F8ED4A|nr:Sensory transduction protein LytR [Candidatus Izimaplasma bacterium HR1]
MKIKIVCQKDNYDKYKSMLEKAGFIISADAELTFREDDYKQETFIGEVESKYEIIHYSKIVFIESFGHEISLHTMDKTYSIREKLYEVEGVLHDKDFIRINKSQIINKKAIQEINPTFNSRIILLMRNKEKLTVTRNYNQAFKRSIGL